MPNIGFFLPRVRSYDRDSIFVHLIWRFLPAFQRFSHQRTPYIDIGSVSSSEELYSYVIQSFSIQIGMYKNKLLCFEFEALKIV